MRLKKLDRWVSLLTNVGVLIGIVLLIFELNQNTQLMRAEISSVRAEAKAGRQMMLANSGDISRIVQTAFAAGFPAIPNAISVLTPEDRFRYGIFLQGIKEAMQNWHYQCQQELLDEEVCETAYEAEIITFLPMLSAMNIDFTNSRPSFVTEVRRIAAKTGLPAPNEDGTWNQ